jgi:hypothetical protein
LPYSETVHTPRWFALLCEALALVTAVAVLVAIRDESAASDRLLTAGLMTPAVLVLLALALIFGRLHIDVGPHGAGDALRFHFGPFGRTLEAGDIRAAEAEPYRWLAFGGWGIRFGRTSGRTVRAYSVPFWRTGVTVETTDGKRYYISSRRPEALAAAVRGIATTREGQA